MKELLKNVTKEQTERLSKCQTAVEILALAEEFGVNINNEQAEELLSLFKTENDEICDEMLDTITGGIGLGYQGSSAENCPICFKTGVHKLKRQEFLYYCPRCRYYFNEALPYSGPDDNRTDKSGRFV